MNGSLVDFREIYALLLGEPLLFLWLKVQKMVSHHNPFDLFRCGPFKLTFVKGVWMGSVFSFTVNELFGYLFKNNVYLDISIVDLLFSHCLFGYFDMYQGPP